MTFDPFSPEVIADPYPHYRRLQEETPVSYIEERQVWVLVRHDDVRAALRDHARMSSAQGVMYILAPLPMMPIPMLWKPLSVNRVGSGFVSVNA